MCFFCCVVYPFLEPLHILYSIYVVWQPSTDFFMTFLSSKIEIYYFWSPPGKLYHTLILVDFTSKAFYSSQNNSECCSSLRKYQLHYSRTVTNNNTHNLNYKLYQQLSNILCIFLCIFLVVSILFKQLLIILYSCNTSIQIPDKYILNGYIYKLALRINKPTWFSLPLNGQKSNNKSGYVVSDSGSEE